MGHDGAVARFAPERGWEREFLLSSAGFVARPTLRGVAWPEAQRAHAVGDLGAMWLWRGETGLWERDPAAPVGFEGNLQAIAFRPGDPFRGYAAGTEGVLLRYDKTWTQEPLPAGFERASFWSLAFAGDDAIAVAEQGVLVNDGGGWRVDAGVQALLDSLPRTEPPQLLAAAGLPDGGAVVAGRELVLVRDSASSGWRFSDQPLVGLTAVAAAATRDAERVRPVVSAIARLRYPIADQLPEADPNVPPPIVPPYPLAPEGYLLRETGSGWRDETRTALTGTAVDRPLKADPIHAFALGADGEGWAVGGWSGHADSGGRGTSSRSARGRADRARVQTGAILRYRGEGGPGRARGRDGGRRAAARPGPLRGGRARAVRGALRRPRRAGDRSGPVARRSDRARATARRAPRGAASAPLHGRAAAPGSGPTPPSEMERYATLLSGGGLPVFAAVSAGDVAGGSAAFRAAFAQHPAPLGAAAAPPGVTPVGGGTAAARTHYAFDSDGPTGVVRVIVIDNSAGSLAESDPHQVPAEPGGQAAWLRDVLADAKTRGIPAIVMGSRDLNTRFAPRLKAAATATRSRGSSSREGRPRTSSSARRRTARTRSPQGRRRRSRRSAPARSATARRSSTRRATSPTRCSATRGCCS